MARKKKKKDRPQSPGPAGAWLGGRSEPAEEATNPPSDKAIWGNPLEEEAAPAGPAFRNSTEEEDDAPAEVSEGMFAKLGRWWRGESGSGPEAASPGGRGRGTFLGIDRPADPVRPSPAPAEIVKEPEPPPAEETPEPLEEPAPAERLSDAVPPSSKVDRMFALMTIQKMTQDTEQARAELETERERNRTRIQELEFERDRSVAEAEKAIAGRMESEKHTAVLRRALEGLERKLLEEKAATDVGLRQLEAERSQVESRIRALEQELEASQRRPRAERETAEARIRQLEAEREELASKLAAREREAPAPAQGKNRQSAARQNTEQVRLTGLELEKQKAVVETLRAELAEARAAAKAAEAAAAAVASPAPGSQPGEAPRHPDPLPHTPIEEFYERAVTRLTVVLASAELLAMSPRLEASLRETAEEIKIQGQALLEIIRKFALPPKPKPPEAG